MGVAAFVMGAVVRWALRRYLRRKFVSIFQDSTDRIQVPATQSNR